MSKSLILLVGIALMVSCTNVNTHHDSNTSSFESAKDPDTFVTDRKAAARLLDPSERIALQRLLLQRIPKTWATSTAADDASVLGEIGDAQAAKELEKMMYYEDSGKMTTAIRIAIDKIEKRSSPRSDTSRSGN